ncbi:MAG: transcriptional regulator [Candidatus Rokuibacteriota bacterium]|nr:MAG: transcriptional regulator [Candidatus Rokubacteria bacterium]
MAQALTIGQVAKSTGVAAKTIRYYEQIGVLPTPSRTASGYRQYGQPGVQRLRFIRRARALGLPLQDLKALTITLDGGPCPALRPRLLALVREQLSAVQHQIAALKLLQQQLEQVSRRLLTSPRGRQTGACRCLEVENAAIRPPSRRARHT